MIVQEPRESDKLIAHLFDQRGVITMLIQPDTERIAFNPGHFYNRINRLFNLDSLLEIAEPDKIFAAERRHLFRDRSVFLVGCRDLPVKATNGQLSLWCCDRVGEGE